MCHRHVGNRALFALSLMTLLSGCMTAPQPIDRAIADRIKRVDVISVAAGDFHRRYTGLTVFNNEKETRPVPEWGLDKAYEAQIAEAIKSGRQIVVAHAPYQRELFSKANDINRGWEGGYAWQDIEAPARAHCSANSLDALFVLNRSGSGDFMTGSNQSFNGIGLYSRGGIGQTQSYLHVVTTLALLDCQSGKPLLTRYVTNRLDGLPGDVARSIPHTRIPFDKGKEPISHWSASDMDVMRNTLQALPARTWSIVVNSMLPR